MRTLVTGRGGSRAERAELAVPAARMAGATESGSFRVLMAAGGTGGHIFPAVAVAARLRERAQEEGRRIRAWEIIFLGTARTLETRVISAAGFRLVSAPAAGLKGIAGLKLFENLLVLPRSALQAARVLLAERPDVVVGMGGYLAGPVMLEAALQGIPTMLIEPNVLPGFTNRVLGPIVKVAAVGFEATARFYGSKARVTGHPVRPEFFQVPKKVHEPPYTILIVGGSQGAKAVNAAVVRSLPLLRDMPLAFIHQAGEADYNAVRRAYDDEGIGGKVYPFMDNMPEAFARADLVIARAGAMTVAEIGAAGRAALLIPFPGAADQHQMANARALEKAGAARVIAQSELTPERLAATVREMLSDGSQLARMEAAAKTLSRPDAADRIAGLIEALAHQSGVGQGNEAGAGLEG